MKNKSYRISALLFVVITWVAISFSGIRPMLFPSQEVDFPSDFGFGPIVQNVILRQEIFLKKDYIQGVEVILGNSKKIKGIENIMLLTDAANNVLFTKRFKSEEVSATSFFRFDFKKNIRIGRGKNCFICFYSTNADQEQFIALIRSVHSHFGSLSIAPVINNDVISSLGGKYDVSEGSMIVKTYETNSRYLSGFHIILYLLALFPGLVIFWFPGIRLWMIRFTLPPEWVYLIFGILSGLILVFMTPPLQSPDENKHFFRSYQVSELNFFQHDPTIPLALQQLAANYAHLNFALVPKTGKLEWEAMSKLAIHSSERVDVDPPKEILPFMPQAIGISVGRIFTSSPLYLMYAGRIFNLFISLLIIFFAIRITPVFKWVFFLVALMPMTIFLFSSLSHDVLTISLTFLFAAFCFRLAYGQDRSVNRNELILLCVFSFLLALCKQPYFLSVFLYFLIPVNRIGTLKKYLFVFGIIGILVISATEVVSFGKTTGHSSAVAEKSLPPDSVRTHAFDQTKAGTDVDPVRQRQFVLSNPFGFVKILVFTLKTHFRSFYLETMVGKLGWLSVFLPAWLINFYLVVLMFIALTDANPIIKPGWKGHLLVFGVGILIIIMIETALYLVWTPVGNEIIFGVQGRYFIPVVPLILFIFYTNYPANSLNMYFSPGREKRKIMKATAKAKAEEDIIFRERLFSRFMGYLVSAFVLLSLVCTLYTILDHYYIILR